MSHVAGAQQPIMFKTSVEFRHHLPLTAVTSFANALVRELDYCNSLSSKLRYLKRLDVEKFGRNGAFCLPEQKQYQTKKNQRGATDCSKFIGGKSDKKWENNLESFVFALLSQGARDRHVTLQLEMRFRHRIQQFSFDLQNLLKIGLIARLDYVINGITKSQ